MRALARVLSVVVVIIISQRADGIDPGRLCIQVLDPMGKPLPFASIVAIRQGEHLETIKVQTDPKGWACVMSFSAAVYSIEGGAPGFVNVRFSPLRIRSGVTRTYKMNLPIGDIHEGGISWDVIVAGQLTQDGTPLGQAEMCFRSSSEAIPVICSTTSHEGRYSLSLRNGPYELVFTTAKGIRVTRKIDLSLEQRYVDKIKLP